jgi:putative sterol carrier protein
VAVADEALTRNESPQRATANARNFKRRTQSMAGTAEAIKEIFSQMPNQINADAAKGMNSVIQFNLSGEGGGNYYVEIKDGTAKVSEGTHASPNMTMTLAASDYVDLIGGKLNGQMAFMSGKLKIAGDMGLAMKMQTLFKRP